MRCAPSSKKWELFCARARNGEGATYEIRMQTRPPPSSGERSSCAPTVRRRVPLAMSVALEVVAELRLRDREAAARIIAELKRR